MFLEGIQNMIVVTVGTWRLTEGIQLPFHCLSGCHCPQKHPSRMKMWEHFFPARVVGLSSALCPALFRSLHTIIPVCISWRNVCWLPQMLFWWWDLMLCTCFYRKKSMIRDLGSYCHSVLFIQYYVLFIACFVKDAEPEPIPKPTLILVTEVLPYWNKGQKASPEPCSVYRCIRTA